MADPGVKLFISCVSGEFGVYREPLRKGARVLPDIDVKIQEEFKLQGNDTLSMLAEYIEPCAAVVHFVGEMSGLRHRISACRNCSSATLILRPGSSARQSDRTASAHFLHAVGVQHGSRCSSARRCSSLFRARRRPAVRSSHPPPKRKRRRTTISNSSIEVDRPVPRRSVRQRGRSDDTDPAVGGDPGVKESRARRCCGGPPAPQSAVHLARRPVQRPRQANSKRSIRRFAAANGAGVLVRALHGLGGIGKVGGSPSNTHGSMRPSIRPSCSSARRAPRR